MNGRTTAMLAMLLLSAAPALAQTTGTTGTVSPMTGSTSGTATTPPAHSRHRATTTTAPATTAPAAPSSGTAQTANLSANQFSTEAAAKAHCPSDTVVWANTGGSKAYHLSGDRYYGKTKRGAYMCQKDAEQSGYHQSGKRAAKAKTSG
jgi:hypothetical protein